jgi:hypothetical protein
MWTEAVVTYLNTLYPIPIILLLKLRETAKTFSIAGLPSAARFNNLLNKKQDC